MPTKWLQERAWDTPTKGLLWVYREVMAAHMRRAGTVLIRDAPGQVLTSLALVRSLSLSQDGRRIDVGVQPAYHHLMPHQPHNLKKISLITLIT